MAIDTRQKRFSMMNHTRVDLYINLFEADGSVDADDRAHLLHLYSGISLASPVQGFAPYYYYQMLLAREDVR
jgi:hypothetical protein